MTSAAVGALREAAAPLPTPCLFVDAAACRRNIRTAADYFSNQRVSLRPHYKAHKCSKLLELQVEAGGCSGVTCATAYEAEILAERGFSDVLVANQVADEPGIEALMRAAQRTAVTVAVDDLSHVGLLAGPATDRDTELSVVIEIDVGMDRCGLSAGDERLLPLAEAIEACGPLTLRGLQAYEGHAVARPTRDERRNLVAAAADIVQGERERLVRAGFPCPLVSGGGTGTFDLAAEAGALDEIQAGSYVLMDARYASLDLPFENALYCAATVLSVRRPGAAALNAGLKSLSAEFGMPRATTPGVQVTQLADEHAWVAVSNTTTVSVGQTEFLIPAHIDPTINLHDAFVVWDAERSVLEHWEIDGRRRLFSAPPVVRRAADPQGTAGGV